VFRATRPPCGCRVGVEFNPVFSENSGFSKKPGKRRLARSTQFSRNRIPGFSRARDGAVPPAPDRFDPSSIGPIRIAILGSGVKRNFASRFRREATAIADESPLERSNPCGEAGL
jgi:hypothetical protein